MRLAYCLLLCLAGCGAAQSATAPVPPPEVAVVEVLQPAGPTAQPTTPSASELKTLDGLEVASGRGPAASGSTTFLSAWFVEQWDTTNPATIELVEHPQLGKCLRISSAGGDRDKSAIGIAVSGSYSGRKGIRLDFHNPLKEPLKAAAGLFLGASRRYYESPLIALPPGYSTHTVPLLEPVWKSRQTGWRHEALPEGLEQVVQVDVMVYAAGKFECLLVYIDQPAVVAESPPPTPAPEAASGILTPEEEGHLKARLTPAERAEILKVLGELEKAASPAGANPAGANPAETAQQE